MENRSIWHVVALVATLGLAALVAVVAVTRSDKQEPSAEASPSVTASASPSASPGLSGDGPFVVYALGNEILAFDVAGGKSVSLGKVEGFLAVSEGGRQPGSGRLVAFTTAEGNLWTVARRGLTHVLTIPTTAGSAFKGALVSPDDRKVAVATSGIAPTTVVVDLATKKPTNIKRTKRGQYPDEALVPVAWSLGGTLLYEIPYCECDAGTPGLFALDTTTAASTRVPGTATTNLFYLAAAPSGQALYYGTASDAGCPSGPARDSCEGPPFYLRRLAAGEAGSDIIRRARDYPFIADAISQGGDLVLVHRPISESQGARLELYSAEGERQPAPRGVPAGGGTGLAILPNDVFVIAATVENRPAFVLLKDGVAITISREPETGETLTYLGWLR
ncbi:MAG: hypothetical protein WAT66_10500 [Actinomycetota bacterium]